MSSGFFARLLKRILLAAVLATSVQTVSISVAIADGPQCAPRRIAQNIKDAVLALKATEYCVGFEMPWSLDEVNARVESLRCGPESSQLLDDLINDFEQEYKTILVSDHKHIVCKQAQTITFN